MILWPVAQLAEAFKQEKMKLNLGTLLDVSNIIIKSENRLL